MIKAEKVENDPLVDNNEIGEAPSEIGDIQIEIEDNSFVKMIQDLNQKQVESERPVKRQLSLNDENPKKIKVT